MRKSLFFILLAGSLSAQNFNSKKDSEIAKYVSEVSADSLKSHITKLVGFGTRHTMSATDGRTRGIGAAREWVLAKFRNYAKNSNGSMEVFLMAEDLQQDGKRINKTVNLGNAVAILHGTDKNDTRIFVITGHLDTRVSDVMDSTSDAPGANDDGSGTAAVIESARILSKSKFPATMVFVALSGEEQGLQGAKLLSDKAKNEGWNIKAVLNNDMVANTTASETNAVENKAVRIFSEGLPIFELDKKYQNIRSLGLENDGEARQLARYVKENGEKYVPDFSVKLIYRNDRFLRGGDHTEFIKNGFPAVRLTEFNENFDHQHQDIRTESGREFGDLMKFMDFNYFRKNVQIDIAVLASLAKAPSAPENVKMDVKELTNFTNLSWDSSKSQNLAGYNVLMRETDSPVWQKRLFTKENSIKLPYSKDNYFFAVEAVEAAGNASIPVIPRISR